MKTGDSILTTERLTIWHTLVKRQHVLLWSGECDFRNPAEVLSPVLTKYAEQVKEGPQILDFRGLLFMNSSSVTPVLAFVKSLCSRGIAVHLIYNSDVSWQRITASSMRTIATALKNLSVSVEKP
ncbi:MAG: hypothetical protein JNJ46_02465 [Myxococcales bacterium]|nr:hypothetical protein [Myxococcales bacterium]